MLIKNLFKYWTYQVFFPGTVLRQKYEAFKVLLENDKRAHEMMAELEEIYQDQIRVDFSVIEAKYEDFAQTVRRIVENLGKMCPTRYQDLMAYYKKFDFYVRFRLAPPEYDFSPPFAVMLAEVTAEDANRVGGKAANIATMGNTLNLPVPRGFVVTTNAFCYFLECNDLRKEIDARLAGLDIRDTASLNRVSGELMQRIRTATVPPDVEAAIRSAAEFGHEAPGSWPTLAVRSSAVGEDGRASFAGQYKTVLSVPRDAVVEAYKEVVASKYAPEALYYRINCGFSDMETPMAVLALEMVDAAASGVMYTADLEAPESGLLDIHSIWGLGELLVQGAASADMFKIKKGTRPRIVHQQAAAKPRQMRFDPHGGIRIADVAAQKADRFSLDEGQALKLAQWGIQLEAHYQTPQDVEWCLSSRGDLFLLQTRPLALGQDRKPAEDCVIEEFDHPVLLSGGERASSGVGGGPVFKLRRESDLDAIPPNAVLVARNASATYVRVMDRLSAVVTDRGSTTGHFASVAREFGVPTLVNTGMASRRLKSGQPVTVYADERKVYDGLVRPLLESPCVRKNPMADSPFARKLEYIMGFISPLRLVDPNDTEFVPGGCRSMHDIIRFAHEKCVQEMFAIGTRKTGRKMGAKKLVTSIPMHLLVLDVGEGLAETSVQNREVDMADVQSAPLLAVWNGLSHPNIKWFQISHFDWEQYDRFAAGIISPEAAQFASYAVISLDYLNLNLKFGYHFVVLDTVCGPRTNENHILFRFDGGGGTPRGRFLRAEFISRILERHHFDIAKKSDLVDARFMEAPRDQIAEKLDMLGRLLGATRLMDMYLKEEQQVGAAVEAFLEGRYSFSSTDMESG